MRNFLWPAVLFGIIWGAAYTYSVAVADGDPVGPLLSLGLFGVGVPLLVHGLTLGAEPFSTTEETSWLEPFALLLLVGIIAVFFTFRAEDPARIAEMVWPGSDAARLVTVAAFNLFFFVIVPYGIMSVLIRHPLSSFGWQTPFWRMLRPRHVLVLIIVGGGVLALQLFVSPMGAPLRSGVYKTEQMAVTGGIVFLWIVLTAGLAQSFFLRGVVQSRLAVLLRNEWAGLFLAALVAGLIYAPGQARLALDYGADPVSFAASALLTGSVTGLMFGYIWMRTRNLLLLMLLSGAFGLVTAFERVGGAFDLI